VRFHGRQHLERALRPAFSSAELVDLVAAGLPWTLAWTLRLI
jgi:hypothetical protein